MPFYNFIYHFFYTFSFFDILSNQNYGLHIKCFRVKRYIFLKSGLPLQRSPVVALKSNMHNTQCFRYRAGLTPSSLVRVCVTGKSTPQWFGTNLSQCTNNYIRTLSIKGLKLDLRLNLSQSANSYICTLSIKGPKGDLRLNLSQCANSYICTLSIKGLKMPGINSLFLSQRNLISLYLVTQLWLNCLLAS